MKLHQVINHRIPGRIILQFGGAKLVRHPGGQHELIGGNVSDFAAAKEWASLFAHEIVFGRPHGRQR